MKLSTRCLGLIGILYCHMYCSSPSDNSRAYARLSCVMLLPALGHRWIIDGIHMVSKGSSLDHYFEALGLHKARGIVVMVVVYW